MAYGLYLALDQNRWFRGDFSATNAFTGTLYTDINQVTAKNLTGYSVQIRFHRPIHFGDFFNKQATIVVAADGTFSYNFAQGDTPPRGIWMVKIEISKAGDLESTLNRVEFFILPGPSGGS